MIRVRRARGTIMKIKIRIKSRNSGNRRIKMSALGQRINRNKMKESQNNILMNLRIFDLDFNF